MSSAFRGWRAAALIFSCASVQQIPAVETSTRAALDAADEHVWIYSETPRWWSAEGRTDKLPPEYDGALRAALQPKRP